MKSDGTLVLSGQSTSDIPQNPRNLIVDLRKKLQGQQLFLLRELPAGSMLAMWLGGIRLVTWAGLFRRKPPKQFDSKGWTAWAGGITDGFLIEVSAPVETDINVIAQPLLLMLTAEFRSWYGGAHMLRQLCPLDRATTGNRPVLSFLTTARTVLGSVIGYHWISSRTLIALTQKRLSARRLNPPIRPRPTSNPRFFGVWASSI